MKRLLPVLIVFGAFLCGAGVSLATDLHKGMEAYSNGDIATAMRIWRPIAERGFVRAQYNLGVMYATGQGVYKKELHLNQSFTKPRA